MIEKPYFLSKELVKKETHSCPESLSSWKRLHFCHHWRQKMLSITKKRTIGCKYALWPHFLQELTTNFSLEKSAVSKSLINHFLRWPEDRGCQGQGCGLWNWIMSAHSRFLLTYVSHAALFCEGLFLNFIR